MIIRAKKNKNYTTISNYGLRDETLSLKAKGLYAFLLSKPDDWTITSRGLETQLKESRPTILNVLVELEKSGYIKREKERRNDGKIEFSTTLYEKPTVVKQLDQAQQGSKPKNTVVKKTVDRKLDRIVNTEQVNTDTERITNVIKSKSYGRDDINQLIGKFENHLGVSLPRKQKQRYAANTLLKQHGFEKVMAAAEFIFHANATDKFSPRVATVEDLRDKLPKIVAYRHSLMAEDPNRVRKVHKI